MLPAFILILCMLYHTTGMQGHYPVEEAPLNDVRTLEQEEVPGRERLVDNTGRKRAAAGAASEEAADVLEETGEYSHDLEERIAPLEDEINWWFVPASQKVFKESNTLQSKEEGVLRAARGETESIQLVLRSEVHFTGIMVSFVFEGSNPLPVEWIDIYQVLYLDTPGVAGWGFPESSPERRRGEYPDPLLPLNGSLTLKSGENLPLWIRVKVPDDAAAGEYECKIASDRFTATLKLIVWPFSIPRRGSLKTAFGLGGKGMAEQHGVELWSEEYKELYRSYYDRLLFDYRINAYHLPYSGGGAGGEITDPRVLPYLNDDRVTSFITGYSGDTGEMKAIWAYLNETGAADKAWLYNFDEPDKPGQYLALQDQVNHIKSAAPGLRSGVTLFRGPAWDSALTPFDLLSEHIDLWVLQTDYYHYGGGTGAKVREEARRSFLEGDEIWLYVALAPREPYCNFLLNNSALQHRILFWQIYREAIIAGLLYWQTTYWQETENPFHDIATVKNHDPYLWGDGALFYPGIKMGLEGPVNSIRLECIRDGLEDYEYLRLAEERLGREVALEFIDQITQGFTCYVEDPCIFEDCRRQLGEIISSAPSGS